MSIVSEYVSGGRPAQEIVEKYHISSRQVLFNWMDKYVNERELVSLPENEEDMAKRTPEERIHELEAENQRLSKALKLEKLRSGDGLNVIEDRIYTTTNGYSQPVARFSEAFRNKLSLLRNRGYDISSAKIRFLLFWHYENPDKTNGASKYLETAIILPEIKLKHKP